MFNKRGSASTSSKGRSSSYASTSSSAATKTAAKSTQLSVNQAVVDSTEIEPTVVIPHIKISENPRILPKYTAALSRSKDEFLPAEELDAIQLEIERLLSNVALRRRVLKSECESIEKDDKRTIDRRNKLIEKQPISPGKRKRQQQQQQQLQQDDKTAKVPQFKLAKQKILPAHSPAQSLHTDDSMDANSQNAHHHQSHIPKSEQKINVPKNDTPNKFWLSVEPYCMPLTNEDLRLLDDLLEQYSGPLVPPIPDLGPHYSTSWAAEDLKDEQDNSNSKTKTNSKTNSANSDVNGILKKGEKIMGEGVTGPLTQRLVSALMEENLMADGLSNADSNSSSENTTNSTSTLRSLSLMKNGISIEKRMKKELIEQGILEPDDFTKGQEDEILSEIKRVLAELSAIAEYNSSELRRLQTAAKAELQRLEIKRKLDGIDQEIIEMYKKVVIAKQKRRPLTSEEQEEIFRLTQEQRKLCKQLESMPVASPNINDIM